MNKSSPNAKGKHSIIIFICVTNHANQSRETRRSCFIHVVSAGWGEQGNKKSPYSDLGVFEHYSEVVSFSANLVVTPD